MKIKNEFEPFVFVKEKERSVLRLSGSEKKLAVVNEDKVFIILEAMVNGWDIDIKYATINGELDVSKYSEKFKKTNGGRLEFKGNLNIWFSEICAPLYFNGVSFGGKAYFFATTFKEKASFSGGAFLGDADFNKAIFNNDVYFSNVEFFADSYFWEVSFFGEAHFYGAITKRPASFADVRYRENSLFSGILNDVLHPLISPLIGIFGLNLKKKTVTTFSGLNTTMMDGVSNLYLKRYIEDEQWLKSWRRHGKLRGILFFFWELTSHCGRSFGLWTFWVLMVAIIFGAIFADYNVPSWLPEPIQEFLVQIDPKIAISTSGRVPTQFTPYYFSIVTFTTLGFGDVHPLNLAGEIWLVLEVILGYIMLGGLISIFANKFSRRS